MRKKSYEMVEKGSLLALCRFGLVIYLQFSISFNFLKVIIMSHEHVSNIGRIWKVFGILSAVTIVEVYLGILKPDFLFMNDFFKYELT
jgi:hypothetical protein